MSELTRRTFLRGAGAALALPWLESLPLARGDQGPPGPVRPPLRVVWVYVPNGVHLPEWRLAEEGPLHTLPPLLAPLQPFAPELLLLSGLTCDKARANGDGPGDHARSAAAFLTGAQPFKTAGDRIRAGVSVDQLAARRLGAATRFPSLELGCEPSLQGGSCDSGYSCTYSSNLAWRSATQPVAKEIRPVRVFERLFAAERGLSPEERARRARARSSVLDFALEDARALAGRLDGADRAKLEQYLEGLREVERRIASSLEAPPPPELAVPEETPADPGEHLRVLFDLLALAFQGDHTRVATLLVGNEGSNRSYRALGVPEGHHSISHHGGDAGKQAMIRAINRFHVEQLAYFLARLRAIPEGEGTLLDHTLVVYGSGIADGDRHDHHDLPLLLAGRAGGSLVPGRHVRYPQETPLANLHLAVLRRLGVDAPGFGDSTGALPRLDESQF